MKRLSTYCWYIVVPSIRSWPWSLRVEEWLRSRPSFYNDTPGLMTYNRRKLSRHVIGVSPKGTVSVVAIIVCRALGHRLHRVLSNTCSHRKRLLSYATSSQTSAGYVTTDITTGDINWRSAEGFWTFRQQLPV